MTDVIAEGVSSKLLEDLGFLFASLPRVQELCGCGTADDVIEAGHIVEGEEGGVILPLFLFHDDTNDRRFHYNSSTHSWGTSRVLMEIAIPEDLWDDLARRRKWFMSQAGTIIKEARDKRLTGGFRCIRNFTNRQGPVFVKRKERDDADGVYGQVMYDILDGLVGRS